MFPVRVWGVLNTVFPNLWGPGKTPPKGSFWGAFLGKKESFWGAFLGKKESFGEPWDFGGAIFTKTTLSIRLAYN